LKNAQPAAPASPVTTDQIEQPPHNDAPQASSGTASGARAESSPILTPYQQDSVSQPAAKSATKPSSPGVTVPDVPSRLLVGTVSSSFKSGRKDIQKSVNTAVPDM
jgi:hypothetical protein